MSIRIGDIDVANEIVEIHYQLVRTQLILDYLISRNQGLQKPNQSDISSIDANALEMIQKRFPTMGIHKKS
jgi:hypothetical protein